VATVAVLGAGAMGSALATPAVAAGNRVRLWGTWLDGGLLAELRAGRPHPRTGVPVDPRVDLHDAGGLAAALDGADLVAVAISSDGVLEVARRAAAAGLAPGTPLLLCTKGFGRGPDGGVGLLPDLVGAATKNIYAIAVGLCHGLGEAGGQPWHDPAAATFTQAVAEMGRLAVALGGRQETVLGLAGLGDLEVTSLSGRNRVLGARVGRGEPPAEALAAMAAAGQTVEGVPAARLARDLAAQLARERPDEAGDLPARLPLLAAVNRLLDGDPDPAALVAAAVLPS
jgi:glycerol-3-phosphate dehydrogenase (NAD(P)+)